MFFSELLRDPSRGSLLKSFQNLLSIEKEKRVDLQDKSFRCIGARPEWSEQWLNRYSVSVLRLAALLAWERHLTSVKTMSIINLDISDIHLDQMTRLASIVTDSVIIDNVTHNNQLSSILDSVQSTELRLWNMSLSDAESRSLATALDRVKIVWLGDVNLNIEELCQYDGSGRCGGYMCGETRGRGTVTHLGGGQQGLGGL